MLFYLAIDESSRDANVYWQLDQRITLPHSIVFIINFYRYVAFLEETVISTKME